MADRNSLRRDFNQFFYAEEVPYGLAIMRMMLGVTLLLVMVPRWLHCREIYSTDGAIAQLSVGYGIPELVPEVNGTIAVALLSILLLSLVTMTIGFCTRISLILATVLYSYFNLLDCVSTMCKYSVIATHPLLMLSLSQCGSIWSVDAWLKGTRRNFWPGEPVIAYPKAAAWPRRLIQIFIGVVYLGAAVTKMHTPEFFTGDQLIAWMLTDLNFQHHLGEYLCMFPALTVMMCYVCIVWEVAFIFVCWKGYMRPLMLAIGVLFHFMTTLTLGLILFPIVCFCVYAAFLEEGDIQELFAVFRRAGRKFAALKSARFAVQAWLEGHPAPAIWRKRAPVAFAALAIVVALLGVETEYRMDPYGERRPEGRHQLTALDPEFVKELLAPTKNIREKDKFFSVDVGTTLVGGYLSHRQTVFYPGDRMVAQCNLIPPHGDMYLECHVYDHENLPLDRLSGIATRETYRFNFYYNVGTCLAPGEYSLVVKSAGEEVTRKKFTIANRDCPLPPVGN